METSTLERPPAKAPASSLPPFETADDAGRTVGQCLRLVSSIRWNVVHASETDTLADVDELAAILRGLEDRLLAAHPSLTRRLDDQARAAINLDRDDPFWWI